MENEPQDPANCTECQKPIPPESPLGICPYCCFGAVNRNNGGKEGNEIKGIELGEVIGEGSFGVVYDGVQLDYSLRRIAVKVMKGSGFDAGHRARFLEEMQILALLKHPHIAQLVASGQMKDGRPYYAMEFIDGKKLDVFAREDMPDANRLVDLAIQLTEAVSHAHQRGIVHRDLKPSNVLIENETGEVRVIDFGIARVLSGPLVVSHEVTLDQRLGTPRYMSPEQLEGDPQIDTLTDIYALGLLIYELSLHRSVLAPVISPRQSWTENAQRLKAFSFPGLATHGAPKALDWIARKACSYERANRYQTAESLLEDLTALREGKLVKAGQHYWLYRTGKLAHRYRIPLTIFTLVLLLLAAIAGMGIQLSVKERKAKEEISKSMEQVQQAEKNARQDASDARLQEANLALQAGNSTEALGLLNQALDLWPENSDARYARDFLIATQAFPGKGELIAVPFQIAGLKPLPDGFLITGSQQEEQRIELPGKAINHPLDDLTVEDRGNGTIQIKSLATNEPLMSPLVYGTGREMACFSPQTGSILSTTSQGKVQIWDVSNLRRSAEVFQSEREIGLISFESTGSNLWLVDHELHFRRWQPGKTPEGRLKVPGENQKLFERSQGQSSRELIWRQGHGGKSPNQSRSKSVISMGQLQLASFFGDWFLTDIKPARDVDVRVIVNNDGNVSTLNDFGIYLNVPGTNTPVERLCISSDAKLAATIQVDHEIMVFSPRAREVIQRWTPSVIPRRIVLLDGGERLIVVGDDGNVRTYNPYTGHLNGPVIPVSGQLGAAEGIEILEVPHRQEFFTRMDGDRQIKRWDALTGQQIGHGLLHRDGAFWFNCSLDGQFLFSIDQADKNPQRSFLRIWSLRTGKEIVPGIKHDSPMNSATIMDNGQRIATATKDGKVRRWTIPQQNEKNR